MKNILDSFSSLQVYITVVLFFYTNSPLPNHFNFLADLSPSSQLTSTHVDSASRKQKQDGSSKMVSLWMLALTPCPELQLDLANCI